MSRGDNQAELDAALALKVMSEVTPTTEFQIRDSRIDGSLTIVMEGVQLGGNIFQRIADAWRVLRKKEVARPVWISGCIITGENGIIIKTEEDQHVNAPEEHAAAQFVNPKDWRKSRG